MKEGSRMNIYKALGLTYIYLEKIGWLEQDKNKYIHRNEKDHELICINTNYSLIK